VYITLKISICLMNYMYCIRVSFQVIPLPSYRYFSASRKITLIFINTLQAQVKIPDFTVLCTFLTLLKYVC
jgi:hypothetical protein